MFFASTLSKIKLLSSPLATLPKWFAASQSFSPYGLNSWAAITWLAYTKQLFGIPGALFGRERNACRKRSREPLVSFISARYFRFYMTSIGYGSLPQACGRCQPQADGGSLSQYFAAVGRCLPLTCSQLRSNRRRGRCRRISRRMGFATKMPGESYIVKNTSTLFADKCRPFPFSLHLSSLPPLHPLLTLKQTLNSEMNVEEEGAGELAGRWSSAPRCPEG